jgi:hypothetical protein
MYFKEAGDHRRKLEKFVADGAEDWDIKNAVCAAVSLILYSLSIY